MIKLRGLLQEVSGGYRWCAIVLDKESEGRIKLMLSSKVPSDWDIKKEYHVTIDPFEPLALDFFLLNTGISLTVTDFGKSDKVCAVKVKGCPIETNNAFPHITLAINTKNGGKAKDSNDIKEWKRLDHPFSVKGTLQNLK